MSLKYINNIEYVNEIEKLYLNSFSKEERFPFWILEECSNVDNISVRRKNFYLRNGFYDINKFYEDTGINYEVLCTNNEYEVTDDIMKMRYTNMTNNCKLFEVISNTFNIGLVNLKNKHKK